MAGAETFPLTRFLLLLGWLIWSDQQRVNHLVSLH
jgi:hypothetical protein